MDPKPFLSKLLKPFKSLSFWLVKRFFHSDKDLIDFLSNLKNKPKIASNECITFAIDSIELSSLKARDVMEHYSQVDVLMHNDSFLSVIEKTSASTRTRYPVLDQERKPVGIFHTKKIPQILVQNTSHEIGSISFAMQKELEAAFIIPESKRLDDLLQEMQIKRKTLAIVLDEYGIFAGIVAYQDIVGVIVGEIEEDEEPEIQLIDKEAKIYSVSGMTLIEDFEEKFQVKIPNKSFDTVAGFVLEQLHEFPKNPVSFSYQNKLHLTVTKTNERQVLLVNVKAI